MTETNTQPSLLFRGDTLSSLFRFIESSESFCLVGAAGMGKTRLLDVLMHLETQKKYLQEKTGRHRLIRVDLNRLSPGYESWAFYELLLFSILLALANDDDTAELTAEIAEIETVIIQHQDPLLAVRFFELVVNRLCQVYGLTLCFLLDEFDDAYRSLSTEIFLQLRAVRDQNKRRVCYGLFLRGLPEGYRHSVDIEPFEELFSSNLVGLGPYSFQESLGCIQKFEKRNECTFSVHEYNWLYQASGGHPGLLQALMTTLRTSLSDDSREPVDRSMEWFSRQSPVREACRKIWQSFPAEEQAGLQDYAAGQAVLVSPRVQKTLLLKGLLRQEERGTILFSPLFETFIRDAARRSLPGSQE